MLYAALKCSKAVQQRVCNGQIMHSMLMLAVHACFSSQKFGGKLVHKEHVMGGFLTLALTFVMSAGLAGGMEPAKRHFLKGCKGLTHGCLIIYWACFFFYITTFQLGDFPSRNTSPAKAEDSAEPKTRFTTSTCHLEHVVHGQHDDLLHVNVRLG